MGHVAGLALLVCSIGLLISAVVDLTDGGDDALVLCAWGIVLGVGGGGLRLAFVLPSRVRASTALNAVLAGSSVMILASTGAYLLTGTFTRVDDALFESTAGISTTALTVLDPEAQGHGVLFWRALTQWIGGFSALMVVIAVLPFLGVGGPQPGEAKAPAGASRLLSPHVRRMAQHYFGLYVGLTVVGAALFAAAGMGRFDAVSYSLTTVSTGGFANHRGSFAYFDSAVIEWFGVGGMAIAGLSVALIWRGLRGRSGSLLQSTELWVYLLLMGAGSTAVALWTAPSGGPTHESVRHAIFSVVSSSSTTGHTVTDWGAWSAGPQVVLLLLMGVGAMAGSLGGGFRVVRGIALVSYIQRELGRQLRPRMVRPVRVGRVPIDEDLVGRMIGYQVLYVIVVGIAAFSLALFGEDLLTSISGAISGLATVGPALGDLSPGSGALRLTSSARMVLLVVLVAGRLEMYPVLNAADALIRWPFVTAARRVRRARAQPMHRRGEEAGG